MKIALVLTGGLHPSGREQVMPSWLALLEQLSREHEVHAFVLRHLPTPADYTLAGVTVHDLGRPGRRARQARALWGALRQHGPFDVLHGLWADPAGLLTAIAGRLLRVPVVVTCDTGEFTALPAIDYGLQRHWRGRAAVAIACRLASRVHVTSRFMQELAAGHGVAAVRIPVGINTHAIARSTPDDGPPWRLLQVATLSRVKDQRTLLEALAIVRRTHDAHLDLVGEDTLSGALEDAARQLGIASAVTFHGFVPFDAIDAIRVRAHLYVQSSRHEAACAAVAEAAAAGLPIVGTDVGYVRDWTDEGATAVPPGDAAALAAAIVCLLDDRTRRVALGERFHQLSSRYDATVTALAFSAMYAELHRLPGRD